MFSIQRRLLVSYGFGVLMLSVVSIIAALSITQLLQLNDARFAGADVVQAADLLLVDLLNAETGQRGYLLTGDGRYREPYDESLQRLPQRRAELRAALSVRLSQGQEAQLQLLDTLIARKLDELDRTVLVYDTLGPNAAVEVVETDVGQETMDQIRTLLEQLIQIQQAQLRGKTDDVRRLGIVAVGVTIGSTAMTAVVGTAAFRGIVGALHVRDEAEAMVRAAKENLEVEVAARTADLRAASAERDRQLARAEMLLEVSERLNAQLDEGAIINTIGQALTSGFDAPFGYVGCFNRKTHMLDTAWAAGVSCDRLGPIPEETHGPIMDHHGDVFVLAPQELAMLPGQQEVAHIGVSSMCVAVMRRDHDLIGGLAVGRSGDHCLYTPDELRLLKGLADLGAQALANAQLFAGAQRQLRQLQALRAIDLAILEASDLPSAVSVVLERVAFSLGVDAAAILRFDPVEQTLLYVGGRGFHDESILSGAVVKAAASVVGQAVLTGDMVVLPDLASARMFQRTWLAREEGFRSYAAVPLRSGRAILGVLEVFQRDYWTPDDEWLSMFETLGGQAAIALDHRALLVGLERANAELENAYDATLEGWSRALELRDDETQGHSLRVTTKAVELARAMGLSNEETIHVRRGALLHDIGKVGIPDAILLKPGQLTDEERAVMKMHPTFAYRLLQPVQFLAPILDIPYCHHEKWDGTGYPRGLKGEEIPLSARIFAVVDVWDALRSDRPYRKAWPEERVRAYLREQAGIHFDPEVVEAFLRLPEE